MNSFGNFVGLGMTALRSNFVPLEHPYKLNFSITYNCQSRCTICNIWQIKPKNELSLDEIRKFAKKNNYFRWIGITGGEPFLRSDLAEVVSAFKQNCKSLYLVTMPTNSLTSKERVVGEIKKLLDLRIPKLAITLSLDGDRETHDKLRGVPGSFDKVMKLARALRVLQRKHKNLFFMFGYTLSRFNQGGLERAYQAVNAELGGITHNDFHLNLAQTSKIYYNNADTDLSVKNNAAAREISAFIKQRRPAVGAIPTIEGVFLKNLVKFAKTGISPMKSKSLDASLFMDSYGNVYPSIMWPRRVGNVRKTCYDLDPILHSREADSIRRLISEGREPSSWTSCEAYQSIVGRATSLLALVSPLS